MGLQDFGAERISARPLEFIWIVDISGSMDGDKIQSVNHAIRDSIPEMKKVSEENVNAEVLVRCLTFSDTANWYIAQKTPIESFVWNDLTVGGLTSMGAAMEVLANGLDEEKMPKRGLPPVLVLLSDGAPTDDFSAGLKILFSKPWAKKAVRLAIAIGDDADLDVLQKFINNVEIKPLIARNAAQLTTYIKWASTQVLKSTSQSKISNNANNILPPVPEIELSDDDDASIW